MKQPKRKAKKGLTRLDLFVAARRLAGVSAEDFAKNLGVTRQMVSATLQDSNKSARISAAIDSLIAKNIAKAKFAKVAA